MAAPKRPIKRTFTGTVEPPPLPTGPPDARDPRLERVVEAETPAWSFVVLPRGAGGAVREYTLTASQLRRLRVAILGLGAVGLAIVMALGIALPRSLAYHGLLEENLALKMHLQQIDDRMAEIDRMLLRLRLYDAQIKSLAEPSGDHGPLDPGDHMFANTQLPQDDAFEWPEPEGIGRLVAPPSLLVGPGEDLRPAEAWALSVRQRADTFVALFSMAEPDLNRMLGRLEDLRALEEALPSYWPAKGQLTSGFGWRRNPFSHRNWKFHSGLDVANKRGTPIHAAGRGRVIRAHYNSGYGRVVEIDHGFGITSLYAHCTTLYVKEGEMVQPGTLIGTIGSTGRSTGPHLHFEVRIDGHAVDPMDYLGPR